MAGLYEPITPKPYPRPVKVHSHQFYAEGLCLDIINGVALVEHSGGSVARYDLNNCYSLEFCDR